MHDEARRASARLFRRVLLRRDALALDHHRRHRRCCSLASVVGMRLVQQQFFPSSDRPELLVDLNLPQNSSIAETRAQMERSRTTLAGNTDIDTGVPMSARARCASICRSTCSSANPFSARSSSSPRASRRATGSRRALEKTAARGVRRHRRLRPAAGPRAAGRPAGAVPRQRARYPDGARTLAQKLAGVVAANPKLSAASIFDWNEPGRVLRVDVLQDKARQLGITSSGHRQRC